MHKGLRNMLAVALFITVVMSMAACQKTGGSAAAQNENSQTAPGTHFKMGMNAEPSSMDPAQAKDTVTWLFITQCYDTLVKYDPATKEYIPALASEWKVNDDFSEIEFTIRDDITFQNGDKMTMEDVLFSLNRALESSYTAQLTSSIDRFEQIDETHLKLVLKYGYAPIMDIMVSPSWGIVNKNYIEAAEAAGKDIGRIETCGTGAYIMKEWKSGEKLTFEAFENYYEGAPVIKTAEAILIADQASGAIALEDGTLDYYYGVSDADIEHLKNVPSVNVFTIKETAGMKDITFNVTDGIFADKRLRQAVAYALNREEILFGAYEDNGSVITCFNTPAAFGYIEDYQWYQQDLDKARQLMAEAGYPDGFDVVFTQDSSKYYMTAAEIVQAQLKQIGINVTFEKLERSAWLDTVASNRQYEATLRGTTQTIADADYFLTRRFTEEMLGGGNNYSNYVNPELEELILKARSISDSQQRLTLYGQCYDILKEDVPMIPLLVNYEQQAVSKRVQGWMAHPLHRNPWCKLSFAE